MQSNYIEPEMEIIYFGDEVFTETIGSSGGASENPGNQAEPYSF